MTSHRTLILLRHAKAESPGTDADKMRALALRGRTQAHQLGAIFADRQLLPQRVLCSAALRTRQTWEILSGALSEAAPDATPPQTEVLDELYYSSATVVLELVAQHAGDASTVLVVGHEPVISMTADYLAAAGSDAAALAQVQVGVPTASACVLTSDAPWPDWQRGIANLTGVLRPVG